MPSYLQKLREQRPALNDFSDDEIIPILPRYAPEEFGNLNPDQVRFKALDDRTAFGRGLDAGIDQLQAMGGGAAALVGDATGIQAVQDWGLDVYRRNMEEAALSAPETNFLDIDGVGDALNWAGYTLGNLAPMMAVSVTGGGAGGLLANQAIKKTAASMLTNLTTKGMAADLAKREVGAFVAKRVALGQALGAAGASTGMSAGNLYGETEDAAVSAVHGLIAGSIDALPIMRLFGRFGKAKVAKEALETSVIREIGKQGVLEGGTEAVQTFIEQHAKYWAETDGQSLLGDLSQVDRDEMFEAFAAGALGGGVMGGGASVVSRDPVFFRRPTPSNPDDDLKKAIDGANNAANQVRQSGGDALSAEIARATTEAATLPQAVITARETAKALFSDPIKAPLAPITIPGQMPDFQTSERPTSDQTIPGAWDANQNIQAPDTQRVIENPVIDFLITAEKRIGDETSSVRLEAAKRMQALSERFASEGNQKRATKMAEQALAIVEDVKRRLPVPATTPIDTTATPGERISVWTGRRGDGYATVEAAEAGLEKRRKVSADLDWRIEQMPSGKFQLSGYAQERPARDRMATPNTEVINTLSQARTEGETRRAGQVDPALREMQSAAIDRAMKSIERRGGIATQAEADLLNEYGMGRPYDSVQQAPVIAPANVRMSSSGQPFKSEQQARSSVPYRQNPGATVIQSGDGYAVQLPEPLKIKSPEADRIERLEKARAEYEQAYERGQLNESVASIKKADAEIVSFAKESIDRGEAAMFKSKDGDMYYTVTPSAQESGKFQVTVYNDTGMLSDSQINSLDAVSSEIKGLFANPVPVAEANQIMSRLVEAEQSYQQRRSAFEAAQKPAEATPVEATPVEKIKALRDKYEQAKTPEQRFGIIPEINTILETSSKAELDAGRPAVLQAGEMVYVVHPSTSEPGKLQVTTFNQSGALGHTTINSIDDLTSTGITGRSANLLSPEEAEAAVQRVGFAESQYQQRQAKANSPAANRQQTAASLDSGTRQSMLIGMARKATSIAEFRKEADQLFGEGFADSNKEGIRFAWTARTQSNRRPINPKTDSLVQAAIKLGGLNVDEKMDITGDTKGNKNIPGIGALFSDRSGTSIDDLATKLFEQGFIPPKEMENLGGVPWLQEHLGDELAGRKTTYSLQSDKAMEQAQMERDELYAAQAGQLESEREAEYASIEQEYGPEIAAQAREYDEVIENADSDLSEEADYYENQLSERESNNQEKFAEGISATQAAARDDEIRQADDQKGRESSGSDRNAQANARPVTSAPETQTAASSEAVSTSGNSPANSKQLSEIKVQIRLKDGKIGSNIRADKAIEWMNGRINGLKQLVACVKK
jgi:hypothetical protein